MRILLTLTAAVALLTTGMYAQDKGKAKAPPKNLKILTPETYRPLMDMFVSALGLQSKGGCTYCHVQGQMASDENPKKEMARNMLLMTRELNAKFPGDKRRISCYTCHRGNTEPVVEIPAAAPAQ